MSRFQCTYVGSNLHKKRKTWLDGILTISGGSVTILDESQARVASSRISDQIWNLLKNGEEVQVGKCLVVLGDEIGGGSSNNVLNTTTSTNNCVGAKVSSTKTSANTNNTNSNSNITTTKRSYSGLVKIPSTTTAKISSSSSIVKNVYNQAFKIPSTSATIGASAPSGSVSVTVNQQSLLQPSNTTVAGPLVPPSAPSAPA